MGTVNSFAQQAGEAGGSVALVEVADSNGNALGNTDGVVLMASTAQTTTQTLGDFINPNARGVIICVDTTVNGTACSNVVTINIKDPVSGKYSTILTGAAIVGVSTVFYTIYPGVTPATNLAVSYPLPHTYQVKVTAGNANSATYSVGASYII